MWREGKRHTYRPICKVGHKYPYVLLFYGSFNSPAQHVKLYCCCIRAFQQRHEKQHFQEYFVTLQHSYSVSDKLWSLCVFWRCSIIPARRRMTWSSSGSSEKWGILFAHSTKAKSCLSAVWQMLVTASWGWNQTIHHVKFVVIQSK